MIRINLISPEVEVAEQKGNPGYIVGGVAGVVIITLLPISWIQRSRKNHLQAEITSIQGELDRYKPIIAQVEALEQAKAQLQTRKTLIQQLENERLRYPYFIEDLLKLLPNNVWLTSLNTTIMPDGASLNISMDIQALDNYAVADLVSNLEISQIFTDVELGTIQLAQTSTGQTISCHVTTIYHKAVLNNAPKQS